MSLLNPFSWGRKKQPSEPSERHIASALAHAILNNGITQNELDKILAYGNYNTSPTINTNWDGDKFQGGYGLTELSSIDYWTLRERSAQLFKTNTYASGIINRLVTNEINTGLTFESIPEQSVTGVSEEMLETWGEGVENRFTLWANDPLSCDAEGKLTFGEIQQHARTESLIEGDVLVVLSTNQKYGTTTVRLIGGSRVQTPLNNKTVANGNHVIQGIEFNNKGVEVAYHVLDDEDDEVFTTRRIPAFGPKSNKRIAYMEYSSKKRYKEVRGQPILSIILQSLREIDRYRDSAQRKAVLNSMLAIFIKKEENNVSSLPFGGGAIRNDTVDITDGGANTAQPRKFNMSSALPGLVMEELNQGETPTAFGNDGTDINFPIFEQAVIAGLAWSLEIPPEILTLSFNSNYSASQAAINEFKMYLNKSRTKFGGSFCRNIFCEWLINSTKRGRVVFPLGVDFLTIARDPMQRELFNAWVSGSWAGQIKPSTDPVKTAKGYKIQVDEGWLTNDRAAKEMSGTKFSKNIRRLVKENQQKAAAMRPLLELKQEFGEEAVEQTAARLEEELNENE